MFVFSLQANRTVDMVCELISQASYGSGVLGHYMTKLPNEASCLKCQASRGGWWGLLGEESSRVPECPETLGICVPYAYSKTTNVQTHGAAAQRFPMDPPRAVT